MGKYEGIHKLRKRQNWHFLSITLLTLNPHIGSKNRENNNRSQKKINPDLIG